MESSAPEVIIAADYTLAMKSFMNKEFERSFPLIQKNCSQALLSFRKGYIGEELFVKIVVLYLTELGFILNPGNLQTFVLPKKDREILVMELKSGRLLVQLQEIFGSTADIPPNLFYQLYLVYYTCMELLCEDDPEFVARQFEAAYASIDFASADVYFKLFVDMYVYNVLPSVEQWQTAYAVIQTNPLLDRNNATTQLKEIEKLNQQEKKAREQKKLERPQRNLKLVEQRKGRQRKENEKKLLKYKSLNEIKREAQMNSKKLHQSLHDHKTPTAEQLKERFIHYYRLTKGHFQKYSPVLAAVAVTLLIFIRLINVGKNNWKNKMKDTLSMAIKVTYM